MAYTKRLNLTVQLKSPLLITAQQVGFLWESESFIPGSVLRGAVAQIAIGAGQDPDKLFDHPRAPHFGPAHPGLTAATGILPHTARTCKRHGGFRRDAQDGERHGVQDTLLEQAFGQAQRESVCTTCSKPTLPWGGRPYTLTRVGEARWYVSPRVQMRRIGRTGVARERAAVADGLLYTLEVIGEQMERDLLDQYGRSLNSETYFSSFVWLDENDTAPWTNWLEAVSHIGGARTRGLGQVKITAVSDAAPSATPRDLFLASQTLAGHGPGTTSKRHPAEMTMLERICAFNQAAYSQHADPDYWYFTLDLQSDAMISDVRGPQYTLLPETLGLPSEVKLHWSLARHAQAGGWAMTWGLPKPVAPVLTAGSVFVYRVPRDEALTQQVLNRCTVFEQEGIGQRCEEGFGWLHICTPFHLEMEVKS